ncbi:4-oxalocrotonate decarboxylase [Rhodococcus sp. ABRD24]|uniref:2-keto-4-pentenoate hydratase n=1 Tax=Rhodococcus sp. ABRD24 TaxID=2507582 RepID=UPI00103B6789|nr:fumarylacetoacetate hydrolase family protein [Rhodococcus sp. ABRD24]QBJ96483.1 4-oxalocrotonate decarboxylase [Rhodococcus sp. ABRD24]
MSVAPTTWTIESAAEVLLNAEETRCDRHPVTEDWPGLDLTTAYLVQDELIARKVAQGEKVIGVKLGLTSVAKQQRMGVNSPLTAVLTDRMVLEEGSPIPMAELIHPRVEPEIVFVLGERLEGPGVTAETALAAVRSVRAGIEVIDSRYIDFKFTLPDVVADNASSSRFFLGDVERDPSELDLVIEECVLKIDGAEVDRATGAAVQGHPAEALALAANSLAERGLALEAGWIILTGGMTDAVFVEPGHPIVAEFTNLGSVTVVGE